MPVSGVLLETIEGTEAALAERLGHLPGVEVHDSAPGRMVLTTDTLRMEEDRALTEIISGLSGVEAAHVVFSSTEGDEETT